MKRQVIEPLHVLLVYYWPFSAYMAALSQTVLRDRGAARRTTGGKGMPPAVKADAFHASEETRPKFLMSSSRASIKREPLLIAPCFFDACKSATIPVLTEMKI